MSETKHKVAPIEENTPEGMWSKCSQCGEITLSEDLERYYKVCPFCGHHNRVTAKERIQYIVDTGSFQEMWAGALGDNPLNFPGYNEKMKTLQESRNMQEAVVCGKSQIGGMYAVICVMDSFFFMGSMGMAVGEKITRAIEYAIEKELPLIIFSTSGGARMQEGIISLMQMAKTSAALHKFNDAGLFFLSVLTDPTTGGVLASFASLGDIILSEPKALIGFAGKRVIQQTIKQDLPEGFQTAEFLLEKGFVDAIVERADMRKTIIQLLKIHGGQKECS